MRSTFLQFSPPSIGQEEIDEVVDTLRSAWITTGPRVTKFEKACADALDGPAALALSSGTAAMHVALAAMGIGEGDLVFTTPLTFCSTVHVIEQVGATPVLVDVEPNALNIDPESLDRAIRANSKGKARAVMPVHLYGHPCSMSLIEGIAREHDLAIIEDAAHALPAAIDGRKIGYVAPDDDERAVCFSFYATKNLTTAEGGLLVGSERLVEEARLWSLHGMSRDAWSRYEREGSWFYEVVRPGFKYNMTDIQAAIGLQQLKKLPAFHSRRSAIAATYTERFSRLGAVEVPTVEQRAEHAWHIYCLRLRLEELSIDRARFIEELSTRNIGASVHFIPVHLHPYYRDKYGFAPEDFPVALDAYSRIVSLPLHPGLTDEDVNDVIDAVTDIVGSFAV